MGFPFHQLSLVVPVKMSSLIGKEWNLMRRMNIRILHSRKRDTTKIITWVFQCGFFFFNALWYLIQVYIRHYLTSNKGTDHGVREKERHGGVGLYWFDSVSSYKTLLNFLNKSDIWTLLSPETVFFLWQLSPSRSSPSKNRLWYAYIIS